ncbi:MAG: NAD-dependent epimerase/dehydratase family protein [Terriglobales bacterium]
MSLAIVTGAGGLVGAEAARLFAERGLDVIGIDNDMRSRFFGESASTRWQTEQLRQSCRNYSHVGEDIRDEAAIAKIFAEYGRNIAVVIHCAAQPSHEWAVREPMTDFSINANGTLVMLEATRRYAPDAVFIFTSTNKVYGDRPNRLPLIEMPTRFELDPQCVWAAHGISEEMSIDSCLHGLFGSSKVAADVLVQEYGRYFGLKSACFRGGCLTGPGHSGAQLHGFLAYLVQCAITGSAYTIFGYDGKQVRDNIHSRDLVEAFWCFFRRPTAGEVFNIGGGRHSNCSMREAIAMVENLTGRPMQYSYSDDNRIGDHIWWISDVRKFQGMYPEWSYRYDIEAILADIHAGLTERLRSAVL